MSVRARSGRLVVLGILVLGIGGTLVLNLVTTGNPGLPHGARLFVSPTSAGAAVGVTYPVRLLRPCAAVVDFDAGFWEPSDGGTTLRQPAEPATIRLVAPDRAVLRTASGQSISLAPTDGPIGLSTCP